MTNGLDEPVWRSIDLFLPSDLSPAKVGEELRDGIIRFATDGGEFVNGIRILGRVEHPGGWHKWSAAFLVGVPGTLPGIATAGGLTLTSLV
jgi:hypothetical protein